MYNILELMERFQQSTDFNLNCSFCYSRVAMAEMRYGGFKWWINSFWPVTKWPRVYWIAQGHYFYDTISPTITYVFWPVRNNWKMLRNNGSSQWISNSDLAPHRLSYLSEGLHLLSANVSTKNRVDAGHVGNVKDLMFFGSFSNRTTGRTVSDSYFQVTRH